jgi:hypothetical protein
MKHVSEVQHRAPVARGASRYALLGSVLLLTFAAACQARRQPPEPPAVNAEGGVRRPDGSYTVPASRFYHPPPARYRTPEDIAADPEGRSTSDAPATSGPHCKTGKRCGDSCIAVEKECHK